VLASLSPGKERQIFFSLVLNDNAMKACTECGDTASCLIELRTTDESE